MSKAGGTIRYPTGDFPESRVVQLWQECPGRPDLKTDEEGPLQVLYPGRANDDSGADYRDAVIATSRGLQTGDIEIHTRSSQWWAHRHHLDPVYNRVVLHVVFRRDMAKSVTLENGREIPTLALENLFRHDGVLTLPEMRSVPCSGIGMMTGGEIIPGILDGAGQQRFMARTAGYQPMLLVEEAGEALYRGIMGALGYAKNEHAMRELACRVPLSRLERLAGTVARGEYLVRCQAVLLGTAGLLFSRGEPQREENRPWLERLQKVWLASGDTLTMSAKDWHFFRVRPGNLPARRIAAMSRLLLRYRREGLLGGLIIRFEKAAPENGCRELEEAFIIAAGGECGRNKDVSFARKSEVAWLGKERAADIVINVLLPFMAARGQASGRPDLAEKASRIYRQYPALPTNTLVRHMSRQLGIGGETVNTARRQQGLLHLFKTFCSHGGCPICPLGRAVRRSPGDAR
jgi:hypothetical protein